MAVIVWWLRGTGNWMVDPMAFGLFPINSPHCVHLSVLHILRPDVRRKSDLPLYIGQIHAFYFDTTPYTLNDNVNTKSVWLNNLIDVCLQYCIETTWTMFQTVI